VVDGLTLNVCAFDYVLKVAVCYVSNGESLSCLRTDSLYLFSLRVPFSASKHWVDVSGGDVYLAEACRLAREAHHLLTVNALLNVLINHQSPHVLMEQVNVNLRLLLQKRILVCT